MAIPASHIVEIIPRVIASSGTGLEFNGLFFTRNASITTDRPVLMYSSAAAVAEFFGYDSDEYAVAVTYFAGITNKQASPRMILFGRRIDVGVSGWLRGYKYSGSLADLRAVTDGSLILDIDGVTVSLTDIDFSGVTSFSDAALVLTAALGTMASGVNIMYSSLHRAFIITSGSTGDNSVVGYAQTVASGTDLGDMLNLTESAGATMSIGSEALSVSSNIAAIRAVTENWFSYTTLWVTGNTEILELAKWASDNYGWLYVPYSEAVNLPDQNVDTDIASQLIENAYDHTAIIYGSREYAVMLISAIAGVAWQRLNGVMTFAFKSISGLAAYVTDETEAVTLESKNCNYYGRFATRNSEFVFFYPGKLSASKYSFVDSYVNAVWLNNSLQLALIDGLTSVNSAPYNDTGYTMIRAWMMDTIASALNNGTIHTGVSLSEAQKNQLLNEAGQDITSELSSDGYYLQIADPGANIRAQRETPIINLWYTYGGAIQRIEVSSTAIL